VFGKSQVKLLIFVLRSFSSLLKFTVSLTKHWILLKTCCKTFCHAWYI